jgi:predicted AAA+ superfamily ATPase
MAFPNKPWVSLESPDWRREALQDPRGLLSRYPDGAVLDEVQRAPELLSYLQDNVDNHPEARGRWILTGPHNLLLLQGISQSLAGRTALLHLLPLSLAELPQEWLRTAHWTEAALIGGYPAPLHRQIPQHIWLADYVSSYLDRDVRDLLRVGNLQSFERFVRLCAGRSGQLLNLSSLGADTGITHQTARAWLSVLEASFVVFTLQPWTPNLTAREVKTPKLYFWDTGLLCWLLGLRNAEDVYQHPLRGAIFENLIAVELQKSAWHQGERPDWWFYRDAKGLEIDFLRVRGVSHLALEAKSGATLQAEWTDSLRKFQTRMASRDLSVDLGVVYGGDDARFLQGVPAQNWRQVGQL